MRPLIGAYAGLGRALTPALRVLLQRRAARGREDPVRLAERFGVDPRSRPAGPLVWIHAASIGESVSILPVIDRLRQRPDGPSVLLTTITRSSAELVMPRLPTGALHAYAPVDTAPALGRFLERWQPDATVVVEQELWPLMLQRSPAPRLLVNARLSARSARRWRPFRPLVRQLLGSFSLILAQSEGDAARLRALGAAHVETPGNLKLAAPPLPVDACELAKLRTATGERPVWVAASTHEREEQWIAETDAYLRTQYPDLLTIIVPRHPKRATDIQAQLGRPDVILRSSGRPPDASVGIVIGDGFGLLGLYYRLAQLAFIGGSLIPHGGQNPLEPARLGRPVLFGPHMSNFVEQTDLLLHAGAARAVERSTLPDAVAAWLDDKAARERAGVAGKRIIAAAGDAALERTNQAILEALSPA